MITIEYHPLKSRFNGYEHFKNIDKLLSVKHPQSYWMKKHSGNKFWDGKSHFFSVATGRFPTGLLGIVIKYLKEHDIPYEIVGDVPKKIEYKGYKLTGVEERDYQSYAVEQALKYGRGLLKLATNAGKSEILCSITKEIDKKTLVLVHMKTLFDNIYDRLQARLPDKTIGKINATGYHPQQITVGMVQSFYHTIPVPKKKSKYVIKKEYLPFLDDVEVIFGDEIHHADATTWYDLFMSCSAPYRFGLSASPGEDPVALFRLYAATGPVITEVNTQHLTNTGISATARIYMIDYDEPKPAYKHFQTEYADRVVHSTIRHKMIARAAWRHEKGVLILCNRIVMGQTLKALIARKQPSVDFIYGARTDNAEVIKSFARGEIKVLIATSILDEGVDISGIYCLIMADPGKSHKKVVQRVGRGLRKKQDSDILYVYDFLDKNTYYLKSHAKERIKVYKSEGYEIIKKHVKS